MAFIVIIISIVVQYYLGFASYPYRLHWIEPYYDWMAKRIKAITKGHSLLAYAILMLAFVLVVSAIFALVYHLLGIIGYFILNLAFFWYCLDARDIKKDPYPKIKPDDLFVIAYQNVFGIIFWYALFGPVGLSINYFAKELRTYFDEAPKIDKKLHDMSITIEGIINWVPLRLLGLSFAFVGHFAATFKALMKELFTGISPNCDQAKAWGKVALQLAPSQKTSPSTRTNEIIALIHRALIVWLVVLALLSIAFWLG